MGPQKGVPPFWTHSGTVAQVAPPTVHVVRTVLLVQGLSIQRGACCASRRVVSRMETPDHWITYAHVVGGEVMNSDARTAVHRRKVGNYY